MSQKLSIDPLTGYNTYSLVRNQYLRMTGAIADLIDRVESFNNSIKVRIIQKKNIGNLVVMRKAFNFNPSEHLLNRSLIMFSSVDVFHADPAIGIMIAVALIKKGYDLFFLKENLLIEPSCDVNQIKETAEFKTFIMRLKIENISYKASKIKYVNRSILYHQENTETLDYYLGGGIPYGKFLASPFETKLSNEPFESKIAEFIMTCFSIGHHHYMCDVLRCHSECGMEQKMNLVSVKWFNDTLLELVKLNKTKILNNWNDREYKQEIYEDGKFVTRRVAFFRETPLLHHILNKCGLRKRGKRWGSSSIIRAVLRYKCPVKKMNEKEIIQCLVEDRAYKKKAELESEKKAELESEKNDKKSIPRDEKDEKSLNNWGKFSSELNNIDTNTFPNTFCKWDAFSDEIENIELEISKSKSAAIGR